MPWLSESQQYPVCGYPHDFSAEDFPLQPDQPYLFTCPLEGKDGVIAFKEFVVEVTGPTRDAVPVRMVP